MAKNTRPRVALGVEVSGPEVRLALVENRDGTVRLLATQTASASDDLSRVLRALPRRPAAVTCALALDHAGIRVLSLPPTTEENMERVVALEAEAALPLESDDLALSHHGLGMTEQSRLEVLVGA